MALERGSDLLKKLHGGKQPFNDKTLASLASILELKGSKLIGWLPRGTPVWESVEATVQLATGDAGHAIQTLVNDHHLAWNARVFPRGIPVPDIAILQLEIQGIRQ